MNNFNKNHNILKIEIYYSNKFFMLKDLEYSLRNWIIYKDC